MSLSENDIIRIYGHRWDIEVFFKTCKNSLLLRKEGELFYLMISEVADITYQESMQIILKAMLATIQEEFHITDEQVESFYTKFIAKLPESMQRLLQAG